MIAMNFNSGVEARKDEKAFAAAFFGARLLK